MTYHYKDRATLADDILPYLRSESEKWVTCQWCGRTLQYGQLMRHWRKFHDYDNGLIIDF